MSHTFTNVKGEEVALEDDFGAQAQRAAEDHLTAVWSYFRSEEEGEEEGENPAVGAFDGCQTCEVREVLFASLPILWAGFQRDEGPVVTPIHVNLIDCPNKEDTARV